MIRWALLLAGLASPVAAARVEFCWTGAGGYTMTGEMEFPDALLSADLVTGPDVTAFRITGFRDGAKVGRWDLSQRGPGTTWLLHYRPGERLFPTGDSFGTEASQGWNANGGVADCGPGGFGFNSGNLSQDVCIDGVWITESSVDPATPFRAAEGPVTPDCAGAAYLSKRSAR